MLFSGLTLRTWHFPTHHHPAPHAKRLQDARDWFAQFRTRHTDELSAGTRGIQQRAEGIKNRSLAAFGTELARGRDVLERGVIIGREEKREAVFAQRPRGFGGRQVHA